jgi:hypothetical protein
MKDDSEFMERITRDIKARKNDLKKAYRKASMKCHPDRNQDDADAVKKFVLVKCAYELLAEDKPCLQLLEEVNTWEGVPEDSKYNLGNLWGHFLWWREKFFGSKKEEGSNGERSSCI